MTNDDEILEYIRFHYGDEMAESVLDIFDNQRDTPTRFANFVRRSFMRQIEEDGDWPVDGSGSSRR